MTEKFNRYGIHEVDHTKFGGYIFPSDFNTANPGKSNSNGSLVAKRIAADAQFDKQCKKNRENIERNKQYGK